MRATARKVVLGESLGQLFRQTLVQSFENAVFIEHAFLISKFLVRETEAIVSFRHFWIEDRGLLERVGGFFKASTAKRCET